MSENKFEQIRSYTTGESLNALKRDVAIELRLIVIGVALYHDSAQFAEEYCSRLAVHENDEVRGNAILGFGHLARRFGRLKSAAIKPLVEAGLVDESSYVRRQAWAAADDITHFLKWRVTGFFES